ncbi:MAG: methyltransferase domain-containing protein [Alphaproteobacteria bacterium]|nr:methyltransferase domain-containing protein [Alphaproteobacteria bacterium]
MPTFLPDYNCLAIHKMMLADHRRNEAFARAVAASVSAGDVVVDLGAGTGILSILAARAGARRVFAIERTGIAEAAEAIIRDNGCADIVTLIRGDSRAVTLPEPADVLVSEWIGVHVFQENMLPAVLDAKKRLLRPGGNVIPAQVELWLAPLRCNPVAEAEIACWGREIQGINFSQILGISCNDVYVAIVSPDDLAAPGRMAMVFDVEQTDEWHGSRLGETFTFEKDQTVVGIAGWFVARLAPGVVLDTGPDCAPTHWAQAVYPCHPPLAVDRGQQLGITVQRFSFWKKGLPS